MSFEALFQAETLRAQQEAEWRRAARVRDLRGRRAEVGARRAGHRPHGARTSAWGWLHLPHRHAAHAADAVRVA